jgi:hypothetical protein
MLHCYLHMNIRLHIQSPGFQLNAVLQEAALPALIELVQTHRISDINQLGKGRLQAPESSPKDKNPNGPMAGITLEENPPVLSTAAQTVRQRFASLTTEEILSSTANATFPEKIVALSAILQAKNENQTVRPRDIKDLLVRARQDPPANPGRDFRLAWDQGWLARLQAREFVLTNPGWEKAGSLI